MDMKTKEGEGFGDELEMGVMGSNHEKMKALVWEDVSVMVNQSYWSMMRGSSANKNKLLHGLSGYALPGRVMAIMGPSGSGKSTLLDALSGRLPSNVIMTGNVLLNGKKRSIGCTNISYVTQEDHLLGTLTVRETLAYSAHLRLGSRMTKEEIDAVVEETMKEMGLQDCANSKIGNWHLRGISGGEKRRVSISLEMLTQPHVMFLDEPTSGLDSASAYFVLEALKNIALDERIVVCSVHQPSSFTFDLFDDLCLLSSGETVYFGDAKTALKFFAEAGFPCPTRKNPADHFLRCINTDFDKISAIRLRTQRDLGSPESSSSHINLNIEDIKAILIEKYKNSEYPISTRKRVREIALVNDEPMSDLKMKNSSWGKQLCTLTSRSFVNITRDVRYYWIRILFCVIVASGAGIMFFDIGLSLPSILTRSKCYTFFYDIMLVLCVGGLPSITDEWKVLHYERLNGHYGEGVFVMSNFLATFPFMAITAVSSGSIIYFMVKFHMGISILCHFCVNTFCCICIMESIAMIVAFLLPNFLMGVGASAGVIVFLTIPAGLYRQLSYLPKFFWRYPMSYISFTTWSVQGQFKNDMIGLEFDPMVPGDSKLRGEEVLQKYYGIDLKWSKWWDLGAVLFLSLCHRVFFFMVLKYKEKVRFLLSRHNSTETIKHLAQKPSSFRRDLHNSFSKRHQPLHSLSSQEGLSSPLP
ncbi:ABC transporter G family member 15 [Ricinus communis]|uniref:ABC transporter G family member 15 n=1 Tax=Ricinus communis TaxID=3988 RepID=UPI00201A5BCE|nr:ABC transporter G family member 15 [Ricinus communis]